MAQALSISEEPTDTAEGAQGTEAEVSQEVAAAALVRAQIDLLGADLDLVKRRLEAFSEIVGACSTKGNSEEPFAACLGRELERRSQTG
jgi:predicted hydrolase (HD superfamily)